jgi:hypothetical protein
MGRRIGAIEVELTEGAIRVRFNERTLTIPIAPPDADSPEEADFLVRLDDIESWDAPDDETPIAIEELQRVIDAIESHLDRRGLVADFD